ncbi:hypothetical protein N7539_000443 [Penicillium diatomitis]|uniref:Heme haloperoxidase family profile domain-containing protein n=1 Tax=Penicillium diatomitis TaxID=2819901 RepID=A0A9W9XLT3_9EURO|nr:uncharacterized protein N7539_000443 [Penicillium diatomitis]KAJ5495327.1 hypothetical protein N7539_000443 [Penicillium diatomitis]
MKVTIAVIAASCLGASASALPKDHPPVNWRPAGPSDTRGPCPMLNTLANQGFIPHHGRDLTEDEVVNGLKDSINLARDFSKTFYQAGLKTNLSPNATTFSLDDLSHHNILEHDASLSRRDYYSGNDHSFDQATFDQTRSYWQGDEIDVYHAALARQARVDTSNRTNPDFTFSEAAKGTTFIENSAYMLAFGDKTAGTVPKAWVEYFFQNEALPTELGWRRHDEEITSADLNDMSQRLAVATKQIQDSK